MRCGGDWLPGAFAAVAVWGSLGGDALAQEKSRWQLGFNAIAGMPQGEFRDSIPDTRWGGSGYFTHRFKDTSLRFGLELGIVFNGRVGVVVESHGRHQRETEDGYLTNGIYFGRFLTRVQPVYGRWSPYIEGVLGMQVFESSVVVENCIGPCVIFTPTSSHAVSLGGGGGLSFRIQQGDEEESGLSVEVAARYLYGGETEYYLASDLPDLLGRVPSVPQRSATSMVTVSFGIVFDF
jgi:hypothetical protein